MYQTEIYSKVISCLKSSCNDRVTKVQLIANEALNEWLKLDVNIKVSNDEVRKENVSKLNKLNLLRNLSKIQKEKSTKISQGNIKDEIYSKGVTSFLKSTNYLNNRKNSQFINLKKYEIKKVFRKSTTSRDFIKKIDKSNSSNTDIKIYYKTNDGIYCDENISNDPKQKKSDESRILNIDILKEISDKNSVHNKANRKSSQSEEKILEKKPNSIFIDYEKEDDENIERNSNLLLQQDLIANEQKYNKLDDSNETKLKGKNTNLFFIEDDLKATEQICEKLDESVIEEDSLVVDENNYDNKVSFEDDNKNLRDEEQNEKITIKKSIEFNDSKVIELVSSLKKEDNYSSVEYEINKVQSFSITNSYSTEYLIGYFNILSQKFIDNINKKLVNLSKRLDDAHETLCKIQINNNHINKLNNNNIEDIINLSIFSEEMNSKLAEGQSLILEKNIKIDHSEEKIKFNKSEEFNNEFQIELDNIMKLTKNGLLNKAYERTLEFGDDTILIRVFNSIGISLDKLEIKTSIALLQKIISISRCHSLQRMIFEIYNQAFYFQIFNFLSSEEKNDLLETLFEYTYIHNDIGKNALNLYNHIIKIS